MLHGQTRYGIRSRFIGELPEGCLKWLTPRLREAAGLRLGDWHEAGTRPRGRDGAGRRRQERLSHRPDGAPRRFGEGVIIRLEVPGPTRAPRSISARRASRNCCWRSRSSRLPSASSTRGRRWSPLRQGASRGCRRTPSGTSDTGWLDDGHQHQRHRRHHDRQQLARGDHRAQQHHGRHADTERQHAGGDAEHQHRAMLRQQATTLPNIDLPARWCAIR